MPLVRYPTVRQTVTRLADQLKALKERKGTTADERARIDHDLYNLSIVEMALTHIYDGQAYVKQLAKALGNEEI